LLAYDWAIKILYPDDPDAGN